MDVDNIVEECTRLLPKVDSSGSAELVLPIVGKVENRVGAEKYSSVLILAA